MSPSILTFEVHSNIQQMCLMVQAEEKLYNRNQGLEISVATRIDTCLGAQSPKCGTGIMKKERMTGRKKKGKKKRILQLLKWDQKN